MAYIMLGNVFDVKTQYELTFIDYLVCAVC